MLHPLPCGFNYQSAEQLNFGPWKQVSKIGIRDASGTADISTFNHVHPLLSPASFHPHFFHTWDTFFGDFFGTFVGHFWERKGVSDWLAEQGQEEAGDGDASHLKSATSCFFFFC